MRVFLGVLALYGMAWSGLQAAGEEIILSGGPALRFYERGKQNSHDLYWGNFIDSALARMSQIRPAMEAGDHLTWLIFRPAYERRGREERINLIAAIEEKARAAGASLIWFNDRDELISYLNTRDASLPITRLEYFGHSNRRCWMFDYSNRLDGSCVESLVLHQDNFSMISPAAFSPSAYCRSWGCHSGEEYSAYWQAAMGIPMVGAIGKTDYSRGGLPFLSTPEGRWKE